MKTAVVLLNLGGPDALKSVGPFLFNLFNDPAIIRLPWPLRTMIAWLVSSRRKKEAQEIYRTLGGRSPLLDHTRAQALALEQALNHGDDTTRCFIAMRYWHPFSTETARAIQEFQPDKVVLLPLYPQFSTTTTQSSLKDMGKALTICGCTTNVAAIRGYPDHPGLIAALADRVRAVWGQAAAHGTPRLLLSAHGLPERIVKSGDPYVDQCRRTAKAVVGLLHDLHPEWVLCFQSRVGPLAWVKPYIDDEIVRAGQDRRPVVVAPIAFVSEHSETLVELDVTFRDLAERSGVPAYARAATVATHPDFIDALAALVRQA